MIINISGGGVGPVTTLGLLGLEYPSGIPYLKSYADDLRMIEIERRILAIEAVLYDSDTRPKDGDAKQGSARE
jgi:hypothetical protein